MATEYKSTRANSQMDRLAKVIKKERVTGRKAISMGYLGVDGYGQRDRGGKWNDGAGGKPGVQGPAMPSLKPGRRGE